MFKSLSTLHQSSKVRQSMTLKLKILASLGLRSPMKVMKVMRAARSRIKAQECRSRQLSRRPNK